MSTGGFFLNAMGRLRVRWRITLIVACFLAIETVMGIGIVILAWVVLLALHGPHYPVGEEVQRLAKDLRFSAAAIVPLATLAMGVVWGFRSFVDGRSFRSLGLGSPRRGWRWAAGGGLLLGGLPIVIVVTVLVATGTLEIQGVAFPWATPLLLGAVLVAAFMEELLCRGYIQQNLAEARRPVAAIVVTTVIFWLMHSLNPAMWSSPLPSLNLLAAGAFLGLLRLLADDLWLPTAAHFAWNAVQGIVCGLPVSGLSAPGLVQLSQRTEGDHSWWTGGAFGLEGSVLALALQVALVAVLLGLLARQRAANPTTLAAAGPTNVQSQQE